MILYYAHRVRSTSKHMNNAQQVGGDAKEDRPPVERLFPFVRRARLAVAGEPLLLKLRKHLHFLLVTEDLSPKRLEHVLRRFEGVPVLQYMDVKDVEAHFDFRNTKMVGFKKSALAASVYRELKHVGRRLQSGTGSSGLSQETPVQRRK